MADSGLVPVERIDLRDDAIGRQLQRTNGATAITADNTCRNRIEIANGTIFAHDRRENFGCRKGLLYMLSHHRSMVTNLLLNPFAFCADDKGPDHD